MKKRTKSNYQRFHLAFFISNGPISIFSNQCAKKYCQSTRRQFKIKSNDVDESYSYSLLPEVGTVSQPVNNYVRDFMGDRDSNGFDSYASRQEPTYLVLNAMQLFYCFYLCFRDMENFLHIYFYFTFELIFTWWIKFLH